MVARDGRWVLQSSRDIHRRGCTVVSMIGILEMWRFKNPSAMLGHFHNGDRQCNSALGVELAQVFSYRACLVSAARRAASCGKRARPLAAYRGPTPKDAGRKRP